VRARVPEDAGVGALDAPGVMTFDASGTLTSINDEARQWLDELPRSWFPRGPIDENPPNWVVATLARARAVTEERDRGAACVRLRTRSGRWLVCHASTLRDADGAIEASALVIEPAQAAEVAPIVAEAHELSRREKEVAQLPAHGASTADIARELFISTHTVRDYVKAVRRALRAAAHGARQRGRRPARGCLGTTPRAPRAGASSR
jgi:DNA-binding CsgD family transcriptional regulator